MKKFLQKILLHSLLLTTAIGAVVMARYAKGTHKLWPDLHSIPPNFISNSVCFNAKLEHAKEEGRLLSAKTLIIGSSLGLNNVSGAILTRSFGEKAYNFSSWGFKPHETFQVLKQLEGKLAIQRLVLPFNNTEFLADAKQIDYQAVHDHFFAPGLLTQVRGYFTNFTLDNFIKDWSLRTKYIYRDNEGYTLKFADDGSINLHANNFVRSEEGSPLAYYDTTGFARFNRSLDSISQYCDRNNIELTMVYLPWRHDLLTPKRTKQVEYVANYLRAKYHNKFVDLSRLPVERKNYVDGGHMFEEGAITITNALVDTLAIRKQIVTLRNHHGAPRTTIASL
ncbi:hypothetical protein WBJ53_07485 [Spirosoma sp. SC4-14]|uniref:hypothetical protein n=1 Tax=Spirosoma sp. SC4-14 TaxID=3128900 RepID=UPI0030D5980B